MVQAKIHLTLRGNALCDFQSRDGGRFAVSSVKQFKMIAAAKDENESVCKECARKLERMERNRKGVQR